MSAKITICLARPAHFLDVSPKTSETGDQLLTPTGVPIWRIRCIIDADARNVSCPASIEEIKGLKYFAPVHFHGLTVGTFKDNLYLTAMGLDSNPENLPLRKMPPLRT